MSEKALIIVPAYNAAQTVGDVIRSCREFVSNIVAINDGSRDETAGAAMTAGAAVVTHPINRGKGAALKTGFAWALARGDDIVIMPDADGQHLQLDDPNYLRSR